MKNQPALYDDKPEVIAAVYQTYRPHNRLPLIFDSPHSGRDYPSDFHYHCSFPALENAEDNYVDELFNGVTDFGATFLKADFPRTYIDVNRAASDIDPHLLCPAWLENNPHWHTRIRPTRRSHGGFGLIRRLIQPGIPLYNDFLQIDSITKRIDSYYTPYHAKLAALIDQAHYDFGQVWHINCHSMPASAAHTSPLRGLGRYRAPLADFVLGDRDGTSCDIEFMRGLRHFLQGLGYKVAVNKPYRGAELIQKYSAPAAGRHSIQIEINKRLYWDEEKRCKTRNFAALKLDLEKMTQFCATYISQNFHQRAAD
jgi:N-formylglutamate amidohydrolase